VWQGIVRIDAGNWRKRGESRTLSDGLGRIAMIQCAGNALIPTSRSSQSSES
jgi:hypothetical protein